jgi:Mn-dependent DtxR family transcriptional regulator
MTAIASDVAAALRQWGKSNVSPQVYVNMINVLEGAGMVERIRNIGYRLTEKGKQVRKQLTE